MSAVRYFDLEQGLCLRDCVIIGAPSKDPARFVDWDFGFRILRNKEALECSRVPKKQTTTNVAKGKGPKIPLTATREVVKEGLTYVP